MLPELKENTFLRIRQKDFSLMEKESTVKNWVNEYGNKIKEIFANAF